jgi:hypothetical protein
VELLGAAVAGVVVGVLGVEVGTEIGQGRHPGDWDEGLAVGALVEQ